MQSKSKIPVKLRAEMDADPWMHRCCVTGATLGKIDWHHNLIFAGKQVNERWCILPLSKRVHDRANRKDVRDILDWIMLNRAKPSDLGKYSKAIDLVARCRHLNMKFGGAWRPGRYADIVL